MVCPRTGQHCLRQRREPCVWETLGECKVPPEYATTCFPKLFPPETRPLRLVEIHCDPVA